MADFGWVGDLNDNFVNIVNITEVYFKLDAKGELDFIFATTTDNQNFELFNLPHVGEIVSTPSGNVTMSLQDAKDLVGAAAVILESHEMLTSQEFIDDMLEALGNF